MNFLKGKKKGGGGGGAISLEEARSQVETAQSADALKADLEKLRSALAACDGSALGDDAKKTLSYTVRQKIEWTERQLNLLALIQDANKTPGNTAADKSDKTGSDAPAGAEQPASPRTAQQQAAMWYLRFPPERMPTPTWSFALVVVYSKKKKKYLIVSDPQQPEAGWFLCGGRVMPGEMPEHAAVRDTLQKTGLRVRLEGILRTEYSTIGQGLGACARFRVIYVADLDDSDDAGKKDAPDKPSGKIAWVTADELPAVKGPGGGKAKKGKKGGSKSPKSKYEMRGVEAGVWIRYLDKGGAISPLEVMTHEFYPVLAPGDEQISSGAEKDKLRTGAGAQKTKNKNWRKTVMVNKDDVPEDEDEDEDDDDDEAEEAEEAEEEKKAKKKSKKSKK